jgi:hypothetical protein
LVWVLSKMNLQPTKQQTADFDAQRAAIYKEQENMSIEKLIKEGSAAVDDALTKVMEAHEELVTHMEGEIEDLGSANDALRSLAESLAGELKDAKNELIDIEEKGLSI